MSLLPRKKVLHSQAKGWSQDQKGIPPRRQMQQHGFHFNSEGIPNKVGKTVLCKIFPMRYPCKFKGWNVFLVGVGSPTSFNILLTQNTSNWQGLILRCCLITFKVISLFYQHCSQQNNPHLPIGLFYLGEELSNKRNIMDE